MLKMKVSPLTIIIAAAALYLPLLKNFFWSDDWYFLWISRISSFGEFLQFFSFGNNLHTTPMYRPLSTQVFFFIFQNVFGIHAGMYYFFSILVWGMGLYVLYLLLKEMFKDKSYSLVILAIYALSASHFARLSYLSAFQEVLMFTTGIAAVYWVCFKKRTLVGIIAFVAALLSKESAIVLPGLMIVIEVFKGEKLLDKKMLKKYLPIFIISLVYVYLRFVAKDWTDLGSGNYAWNFSPLRAIHTTVWYGLWSIGLPELVIHYVGNNASILPRFWTDFPTMSKIISATFLFLIGAFSLAKLSWVSTHLKNKESVKVMILGAVWFIVGLLPIVFLPDHKYVLGQSFALVGMGIMLAHIITGSQKYLGRFALLSYVALNLVSIVFLYQTHVSLQRSQIARNTHEYFTEKYPRPPVGIYFKNDKLVEVAQWGQSRQIHQAVGDYFFPVVYKQDYKNVAYEDDLNGAVVPESWEVLPSSLFVE